MGKSATAEILARHGLSIADTDILARNVVEPSQPALADIRKTFGDSVISADGSLRRDVLARIVFSDPQARQKLEAITHPRIRESWKRQVEQWRDASESRRQRAWSSHYCSKRTRKSEFDATICVACSTATQQHGSGCWNGAGPSNRSPNASPRNFRSTRKSRKRITWCGTKAVLRFSQRSLS